MSGVELKKLNVNNNKLRTSSFKWLGSLSSLESLDISGNDLSDKQRQNIPASVFSDMHHLKSVTANGSKINPSVLRILNRLPSLTQLFIKETIINLKGAKEIIQMRALEELKISEDKLTQSAFKKLNSVNLS